MFGSLVDKQESPYIINTLKNKMMSKKIIHIGVACWVFNPSGAVLMGQRLSLHGFGTWAPPGGKLEFGETPNVCASRELWEETAIFIPAQHFHHIGFTRDVFPESCWLTIHYLANSNNVKPIVCEPDKCQTWQWFDKCNIPKNLFLPAKNALRYLTCLQIKQK